VFLENQTRVVTYTKCRMKLASDGGRWATLTMTMKLDKEDPDLTDPMRRAVKMMNASKEIDRVVMNETVDNCRLTFKPIGGEAADRDPRVFDALELSSFLIERETVMQAWTLDKKPSGAILILFEFSIPLATNGAWIVEAFGTTLRVRVQRTQQELPLGGAVEDKAARIQRAAEESTAPAAKKRGRPRKAKPGPNPVEAPPSAS
jgi:hypothetical protein